MFLFYTRWKLLKIWGFFGVFKGYGMVRWARNNLKIGDNNVTCILYFSTLHDGKQGF